MPIGARAKSAQATPEVAARTRARLELFTADGRDAVAAYEQSAVFPPTSRPHGANSVDLIDWNRRHEQPRAVPNTDLEVLLTADKATLAGDELATVILEVRAGRALSDFELVRASVASYDAAGRLEPPGNWLPLDFDIDGGRGLARVTRRHFEGEHAAQVIAVSVLVRVGDTSYSERIRFHATASEPAVFDGSLASRTDDGSLTVSVGLEVFRPGHYVLDANLWDARGEPIAWARFKGTLAVGHAVADLVFAGNAVLSKNPQPPFELRELRGLRLDLGKSPDVERMQPAATLPIEAFDLADLSAAPWDSEKKRAKLRALRSLLEAADG